MSPSTIKNPLAAPPHRNVTACLVVGLAAFAMCSAVSAATLGLECRLDRRTPADCPAAGCAAADIRPYNETRRYLIDLAQHHIEEYDATGADLGAPFRQVVIAENGDIRAEGGELGPGQGSASLLTFSPRTGVGGLNILVMPGGEFGSGGASYNLSGACRSRPAGPVTAEKPPAALGGVH